MPVFDANLMFRTTGNLTNSASSAALKIYGTPVRGMAVYVAVPSTTGTTNDLMFNVWVSDDDSTYKVAAKYYGGAQSWASGGKEFVIPFATDKKYAKLEWVVSGSTGTPNFGVVKAGIVEGVGYDWKRAKGFE